MENNANIIVKNKKLTEDIYIYIYIYMVTSKLYQKQQFCLKYY